MAPSLKALRALAAVTAEGSFEGAAQRLGVSRSAVSHLIRDLERQLGVRLLERTPRGVKATHDGSALLSAMGVAIHRIETAIEAFRRDRNHIRLSTISTLASCWLIPRLPELHAQHRHLQVSILTTMRAIDFSSEDIDCAIRHGLGSWPELESTLLFKETLVLVGLPALIGKLRRGNVASRLRSIPIIQAHTRPHDPSAWWRGMGLEGRVPRSVVVVESRALALAAAAAGLGVTFTEPKFIDAPSPMSGLVRLPNSIVPLSAGYFFVVPERNKGWRNLNLLGTWLSAEARGLPQDPSSLRRN
jgi:DNA-binding transcriptional LysR family regulator